MTEKKRLRILDPSVTTPKDHWVEPFLPILQEQQQPNHTYTGYVIDVHEWEDLQQVQITYALDDQQSGYGRTQPPFPAFQYHRVHSPAQYRDLHLKVGDRIEVKTGAEIPPKVVSVQKLPTSR